MAFEKIKFAIKTWKDAVSGGTPITASELNRIEKGINDCATQTNALGDSVSRKTRMGAELMDAIVSANPSSSMPVQLEVKSSMGSYVLIASMTFIGLYSVDEEKFVWRINVPTVSSDSSMPNDELS